MAIVFCLRMPASMSVATLVDIPENPVPEGAIAGFVTAKDGVRLRYARWAGEGNVRRGTVCVFTGRAECIEKYFETVRNLRSRGFAVCVLDWRGQGGSDRLLKNPRKGHVRSFADFELDIDALMRGIVLPDCPAPHFALAHSMGGLAVLRALPRLRTVFERMVLSAPLLGLGSAYEPVDLARGATYFLRALLLSRAYVPGGSNTIADWVPYSENQVTSDPVRFTRNRAITEAAPALGIGAPTIGWLAAAFDAMEMVVEPGFLSQMSMPVLMVAAGNDSVVSGLEIDRAGLQLRSGGRLIITGARHELLQERDIFREQFLAAFDAFIPGTPVFV